MVAAVILNAVGRRRQFQGLFERMIVASAVIDPASLVDAAGSTTSLTGVTGAVLGDTVLVFAPYSLQGITVNGYVSAANTVEIRIQNESAGTIDLASGTWKVLVLGLRSTVS